MAEEDNSLGGRVRRYARVSTAVGGIAARLAGERYLGVKLDREKLREYHELYQRLGGYPYDQDPGRPGWTPIVPNDRWADPKDDRIPQIPF